VEAGKRRATLSNSGLAADERKRLTNVDPEWDLLFPPSYQGGQLVVEYTTACFRSHEDCAARRLPCRLTLSQLLPDLLFAELNHTQLKKIRDCIKEKQIAGCEETTTDARRSVSGDKR
jgi:hypothetical protein